MAETLTTAFQLPQWSSEATDGPTMDEFNAAFANLEANAAYDDGNAYSALPTTGLFPKRYVRLTSGTGYGLYRRQGAAWEFIGGTVSPVTRRTAALSGQVATDQAWTTEQALGAATSWGTFGGDVLSTATIRSSGMIAAAPLGDTLTVGTTGRAYVKTQAAGDLGLVLRAHASTAGNLLTVREQGGSDVLTVDSSGRLSAKVPAGFGGAAPTATAVLAVAPTGSGSDGITTGLLLTGSSAQPTRDVLRAYSAPGDTATIADWSTTGLSFGKLPWGSSSGQGQIGMAADLFYWRALAANTANANYYGWFAASGAAPTDTTKDQALFTLHPLGATLSLPLNISQESNPTVTNLTLYRFTDFTAGRLMELQQVTRTGPSSFNFQLVSDWAPDGRLRTGTLWKGTAALRDARQSIRHVSTKTYAVSGSLPTSGIEVAQNGSFTYSFPTMTTRTFGGCDLEIDVLMEIMLGVGTSGTTDGQVYRLECWVSVNGGAFNEVAYQENAQTSSATGRRATGDVLNAVYRLQGVPNAATFQVQLRIFNGTAVPIVYIRKLDIDVEECSFEVYTAA